MTNPFDLPGLEFLQWYVVLIAVVLMASIAVRCGVSLADNGASVATLDAYELAYLAGGRGRMVVLVVSNLVTRGAARLRLSQRSLLAHEPYALRLEPIERRVFLRARSDLPVSGVPAVILNDVQQARDTLQTQELLVSPEGVWLTRAVTVVLFGVTLLAGVIKIGVGLSRDRPVGYLFALCLAAIGLMIPLLVGPMRTRAGRRVLRRFRRDHPRPQRTPKDPDLAVALWGLAGLYNGTQSTELRRCFANSPGGGGGDSGWSGSSCGGGHCGCGGCGGGGH